MIAGGMALICLFFCGFGAFGYVAGLSSKPIILDCLPSGAVHTVVSLSLVASLITSSPVQVYIISESLEPVWHTPTLFGTHLSLSSMPLHMRRVLAIQSFSSQQQAIRLHFFFRNLG